MRRTVLLGILLSSAIASADAPILGGTPATLGQYPSVVALSVGQGLCTGTLITPEWVLTAAHCVQGLQPSSVKVLFGTVNIHQSLGVSKAASELYAHPDFSQSRLGKHDIGLIKLAQPVTDVAPIPINLIKDKAPVGIMVTMVGFGATGAGGTGNVGIEYIVEQTSVACSAFAGSNDDLLCFSQTAGKGKCEGDSGGPSFAMIDGRVTQVGITSFGDQNCTQFGADTRVDAERDFLLQHIPTLECTTDDDCADMKMCFQKKCIVQPFAPTGLGATCTMSSDCDSGMCAMSGSTGKCSAVCTVGTEGACPDGLTCEDTGGGAGACWPISDDSGCCDASGAGAPTALLGFALVGLVFGRKRRK